MLLKKIKHQIRKSLRKETRFSLSRMLVSFGLSTLTFIFWINFREIADSQTLKHLFSFRGTIEAPDDILIIGIDDISYKKLNLSPRKPFPREIFAEAIKNIFEHKPKILFLDLYVPAERDNTVATQKLAESLKLGKSVIDRIEVSNPINTENEDVSYVSDKIISQSASMEIPFRNLLSNGEVVKIVGKTRGSIYERIPLLEPIHKFINKDVKAPGTRHLINYYGPQGTIRRFSIYELFTSDNRIPNNFFKDKIIFIGFQSILKERGHSDKELIEIPGEGMQMYGVEIHATTVANILNNQWIRRFPLHIESLYLNLTSFFLYLGILSLTPTASLCFLLLYIGIWGTLTYLSFAYFFLFLPGLIIVIFFTPLIFAAVSYTHAVSAMTELKEIKETMGLE